jgi:hypothetical protein
MMNVTLYAVHCILYTVHILYNVYIPYTVYILYTVYCILYTCGCNDSMKSGTFFDINVEEAWVLELLEMRSPIYTNSFTSTFIPWV